MRNQPYELNERLQPPFPCRIDFWVVCSLVLLCPAQSAYCQAISPDTPAGRQLSKLVEIVSDANKPRRDKRIVTIFTKDEDPAELRGIADMVHQETGGMVIQEIVKSEPEEVIAIGKTKLGPLLKISIQVTKDDDHLIENIMFERHSVAKLAQRVGDLIPVVDAEGTTLPAARGVWLARGYGYVVEITEAEIKLFDYTGKFGWQAESDDESEMLFVAGATEDEARITYHPKEHGYNVVRLQELPEACRDDSEWTATRLFDLFADVMTKHYPFFEQRGVDWQALLKEHRPRVSDGMSEDELFDVMESMLKDLNDGHTGLQAEIDGKQRQANTGISPTTARLREAFAVAPEPKSKSKFFSAFRKNLDNSIMDKTLRSKGNLACAGQLRWGRAHEDIGYINIQSMGGYSLGDIDHQVKALHDALNQILSELSDTQALIIDISMNGGGSDLFSLEIASHFTDQKRIGFSKWPAAVEAYRQDRQISPYVDTDENGVMYVKPIYLITNDYTASAAEIFTMCMRALPHVKTVGKPTCGALSDVLDKTLPNGWSFHTSNEVYVDHEGVCHEGPGIPPMVEMEIFDPDDILKVVHHEMVAKVVQLALSETMQTTGH